MYDKSNLERTSTYNDDHKLNSSLFSLKKNTIDNWRHNRMYAFLKKIVEFDNNFKWLTVGDGRFGSDAMKLIEYGANNVLCSDLDDYLIKFAAKKKELNNYKKENAENLSFVDNEFDFVLCKEAYHHFPRPMLALTEMFRVAKIGVILIEPRDFNIDRSLFSLANKVVNLFKKRNDGHFFEEVGNYVYTTSERELEKFMLGIHHNTVAFSGINDHYSKISGLEIENLNLPMKLKFLRLKTIIAVKNLLNLLNIRKTNLLRAILFKNNLNENLKFIIQKEGFKFKILPKNPYI